MDIEKLTIGEAREVARLVGWGATSGAPDVEVDGSPLHVGASVLIRTVTHYYTGRVVSITADEVVLREAAWVCDTGRYHECLAKGTLSEVEPYPGEGIVSVARGSIVDVAPWKHSLPREAKG